jgi:hypothetical protein
MDVDTLRDSIWTHLFRAKAAKSIDELAIYLTQDATAVRAAVNHEWCSLDYDQVSIAYVAPQDAATVN